MKLRISKRARRDLDRIASWWKENRLEAPALFLDELAKAEARLRSAPDTGQLYGSRRDEPIRRLLLADTYHLYYIHRAARAEIVVLAIWGAARGRGPKL